MELSQAMARAFDLASKPLVLFLGSIAISQGPRLHHLTVSLSFLRCTTASNPAVLAPWQLEDLAGEAYATALKAQGSLKGCLL